MICSMRKIDADVGMRTRSRPLPSSFGPWVICTNRQYRSYQTKCIAFRFIDIYDGNRSDKNARVGIASWKVWSRLKRLSPGGMTTIGLGPRGLVCSAEENKNKEFRDTKLSNVNPIQDTNIYDSPILTVYMPVLVVLGLLMFLDAAYSGDWSRIGAISKDTEEKLQSVAPIAILGHTILSIIAATISARRGDKNWQLRGLKTLAGGFVTLIEVILVPRQKTT